MSSSSGFRHEARCSKAVVVACFATVTTLCSLDATAHADDADDTDDTDTTDGTSTDASSPSESPTASTTATASATPRAPRVAQHWLGTGFHSIFMHTESGDYYGLHGPSLVYEFFIGRRWGFMLRGAGYLPIVGEMTGPSGSFSGSLLDVYDQRHFGLDGMFMVALRIDLHPRWVFTAAAGPHVQGFSLTGSRYSPVEDISLGIGGLGKLDFQINHWFSVSGEASLAIDFLDLVDHRNPAQLLIPLGLTVAASARY